jgi:ATP-dependent Lon protease
MFNNNQQQQDTEIDFLPIMPLNDVDDKNSEPIAIDGNIIVLPLRNTVLFPYVILPITVGREKSIKAVTEAYKADKVIGVLTQKDSNIEEPEAKDLFRIGTIAKIVKVIKMPDGSITIILQGKKRFEALEIFEHETDKYFLANPEFRDEEPLETNDDNAALISNIKDVANNYVNNNPQFPQEALIMLRNIEHPTFLVNFIINSLIGELSQKQHLLELSNIKNRATELLELLNKELQFLELKNKVHSNTKNEIDKQQREYFLQQQLNSIKAELGGDSNDKELQDMKKKAEDKKWPKEAKELFTKNMQKLERMHTSTPDYSVIYNHLDLMLDLPWDDYTADNYDLKKAKQILDKDHFGMGKIKERILEYLAVLKLKGDMKSPILCFVGPPGIGKTSLGRSIASAIGRKYVRLSLGGLHDESELRGHRKTYIGAMPGRILQNLRKVNSSNPLMILDEIDKIGNDFRGDPSSALLEILDPEQNHTFYDNYLELEYDLSKVLFIATANSLQNIQPALRDRLEIIELNGYAIEEKLEIVKRHLMPKQLQAHGLAKQAIQINDKVTTSLIENYTRESGVRELDRQLAHIMRNRAKELVLKNKLKKTLTAKDLETIMGKPRYSNDMYKVAQMPGVAVGLAWTYVGGDILFIETNLSAGKGDFRLTGNLGQVMKESASTAYSYLQANAKKIGINPEAFTQNNVHIHVPEGATPKDGPSAGVTMLTALASAFTGKKVKSYLAMTGEITLRGAVLPVGGIKEKVLAAKRAGLKEIVLCWQNEKDIEEVDKSYLKGLKFYYVKTMQQVLDIALER